jgi:hypothetical protein
VKRIAVDSSSARSIGYDASTRELDVEFHSGAVYRYFEVPPRAYAAILAAPSIGRHLNTYVRDSYRFERLRRDAG